MSTGSFTYLKTAVAVVGTIVFTGIGVLLMDVTNYFGSSLLLVQCSRCLLQH